jgi:hypothetical protein
MKMFLLVIVLGMLFIRANAATYYVMPSGSNGANGSETNPWETIQYGVNQLSAGDELIVLAGDYQETIATLRSGTAGSRIIIRAVNGVVLRGRFEISHSYITIDGFEITDNGAQTAFTASAAANYVHVINTNIHDLGEYARYFDLPRSSGTPVSPAGWVIRNNWFHGQANALVYMLLGGSGHLIEENEVGPGVIREDVLRPFGDNHIIRGNYIHDISSGGGHTDIFQIFNNNGWRVRNLVFEKNRIRNFDGQAWMVDVTTDSYGIIVRNNIYQGVEAAGNSYCPQTMVMNNTFIDCGFGNGQAVRMRSESGRGTASNSVVKNNIFYNCGSHENNGWYDVDDAAQPTFSGDYNIVYPFKPEFDESNGVNGSDPRFVNAAGSDFHVNGTSPAIDRGVALTGFSEDFDGQSRPQHTTWDLGAFEFTGVISDTGNETDELSPTGYTLQQNYPNPFNPTTQIGFTLGQPDRVRIEIYDITGRTVRRLLDGVRQAGDHSVTWDGRNDNGDLLPTGIYLYRMQSGPFTQTRKMYLIK